MIIQCPGSFLFVYSLYIQAGTDWTSYISYLFSACLQGILLGICLVWYFRDKREGGGDYVAVDIEDSI